MATRYLTIPQTVLDKYGLTQQEALDFLRIKTGIDPVVGNGSYGASMIPSILSGAKSPTDTGYDATQGYEYLKQLTTQDPNYVNTLLGKFNTNLTDFSNLLYQSAVNRYGEPSLIPQNSSLAQYGTQSQNYANLSNYTQAPQPIFQSNQTTTQPQTYSDMSGGSTTNPQLQTNQQQTSGPDLSGFPTNQLQPGMSGDAVKQLQNWLISKGYNIPAGATGYYGDQTKAAVLQLQKDLGIDYSSGPGYFGPRTISGLQNQVTQQPQFQTNNPSGGATSSQGGTGGNSSSTGNPIADQLTGPFKDFYTAAKGFLDRLSQNGQGVNPNVEITPDRVAEFMTQAQNNISAFLPYAQKEILPYYQNQLKVAQEQFLRSVGYSTDDLARTEADLNRKYQNSFKGIGESAADQGFALSGQRIKQENDLTDQNARDIQAGRLALGEKTGNDARDFALKYGTNNLPNVNLPTEAQALYNLTPQTYAGITGSEEYNQEAAVQQRASELENAFRSQTALNQQKSITL